MKSIWGVFLLLLTAACGNNAQLESIEWDSSSEKAPPKVVSAAKVVSVQLGKETLLRGPQFWQGAEIENSFVQEIRDEKGELIHVSAKFTKSNLNQLNKEIKQAINEKYVQLLNFKRRYKFLNNAKYIWDPVLKIDLNSKLKPTLFWEVDYIKHNNAGAYKLKITTGGSIISNKYVASDLTDTKAVLFPFGPKLSKLTEVQLNSFISANGLNMNSSMFQVINGVEEDKIPNSNEYSFDPTDSRFNQVQAFYYIENFLQYFKTTHQFSLPFSLDINVNVLDQNKKPTTAMFYYRGNIRLGSGDNEVWTQIPQDQSIVLHETSHAIIDVLSGLPNSGEGSSINEGFADFLSASYLNNPHIAEVSYMLAPFKRNIDNSMTVADKKGAKYHDSLIISGTFWEIRDAIGKANSEKLALVTLTRLTPASDFSSFTNSVSMASKSLFDSKTNLAVEKVLRKRHWLN